MREDVCAGPVGGQIQANAPRVARDNRCKLEQLEQLELLKFLQNCLVYFDINKMTELHLLNWNLNGFDVFLYDLFTL